MRQHGESVRGEALTTVAFIRVEWAWLAFLAVQIVLSIGFVAAIIAQTASLGVMVVKSSELASLFAVSSGPSASLGRSSIVTPGLRRDLERHVRARLLTDDDGKWAVQLDHEGSRSVEGRTA